MGPGFRRGDTEGQGGMSHWPLLTLVTFLPLVGAFFILLARGEEAVVARNARWIALWTALIDFALSLVLWIDFDPQTADFQFVERADWISLGDFKIQYHMGIDGISLFFILLSTLLTLICVVASWESVTSRVKEYMIAFLVQETLMVGMFCALDFILFYMFFEGVLIPMFLIIGVWGGPRRIYAAFKFFLYTRLGADAAGDPRRLLPDGDERHHRGAQPQLPVRPAEMAVARLLRLLRRQGADVAGAHLAAGRACRGSDRGLGHPRRHSLEDGRLRLHPLLAADVPARLALLHAADFQPLRHRRHLHLAGRLGADRHEEAGRLFLGCPYGLRDDGRLRRDERGGRRF